VPQVHTVAVFPRSNRRSIADGCGVTAAVGAAHALQPRIAMLKRPLALEDLLIGATALSRSMTLATRNASHFARLGVSIVNSSA
jgi:predicted nucleic acid-binding protein